MAGKRTEKEKLLKAKVAMSPRPEGTNELAKTLAESLRPLLDQMTNLKEQLSTMNKCITTQQTQLNETLKIMEQTAEKVKEVDATAQKVKKKVQTLEKKQISTEEQLLQLQMEKANLILRFQGVPETKGENLKQMMSEALAPVTDFKADYLMSEMDVAYRSYSIYIKNNNLPGEIVMRFSKRHVKDSILRPTAGTTLKIGDSTIRILKDIPFEIRQRRKKHKDLILFLQTNAITYRWLYPEGVTFKLLDKKEKIDSVSKAQDFLRIQLGEPEEVDKEGKDSKSSGELNSGLLERTLCLRKGQRLLKVLINCGKDRIRKNEG